MLAPFASVAFLPSSALAQNRPLTGVPVAVDVAAFVVGVEALALVVAVPAAGALVFFGALVVAGAVVVLGAFVVFGAFVVAGAAVVLGAFVVLGALVVAAAAPAAAQRNFPAEELHVSVAPDASFCVVPASAALHSWPFFATAACAGAAATNDASAATAIAAVLAMNFERRVVWNMRSSWVGGVGEPMPVATYLFLLHQS